jgi:hypothetical protein
MISLAISEAETEANTWLLTLANINWPELGFLGVSTLFPIKHGDDRLCFPPNDVFLKVILGCGYYGLGQPWTEVPTVVRHDIEQLRTQVHLTGLSQNSSLLDTRKEMPDAKNSVQLGWRALLSEIIAVVWNESLLSRDFSPPIQVGKIKHGTPELFSRKGGTLLLTYYNNKRVKNYSMIFSLILYLLWD